MIYSEKGELNPLCISEECTGIAFDHECRGPFKLRGMRQIVDVETILKVSGRICGHYHNRGASIVFGRL